MTSKTNSHMGLKQLRWHPKPCTLGVSGNSKLSAEYDDDDRHHKRRIALLIAELKDLAITKNCYIAKDDLIQMYDKAMQTL